MQNAVTVFMSIEDTIFWRKEFFIFAKKFAIKQEWNTFRTSFMPIVIIISNFKQGLLCRHFFVEAKTAFWQFLRFICLSRSLFFALRLIVIFTFPKKKTFFRLDSFHNHPFSQYLVYSRTVCFHSYFWSFLLLNRDFYLLDFFYCQLLSLYFVSFSVSLNLTFSSPLSSFPPI